MPEFTYLTRVEETDPDLALAGVRATIEGPSILIVIFGTSAPAGEAAVWAERMCRAVARPNGTSRRAALWVPDPVADLLRVRLEITPAPLVAVYNRKGKLRGRHPADRPLTKLAFAKVVNSGNLV